VVTRRARVPHTKQLPLASATALRWAPVILLRQLQQQLHAATFAVLAKAGVAVQCKAAAVWNIWSDQQQQMWKRSSRQQPAGSSVWLPCCGDSSCL
jgi:uncharacterized membrane protein